MKETFLSKVRKEKGLTLVRLSEMSGVSYGTIRKLERGIQANSINFKFKEILARAMKIDVFVLFPDEGEELKRRMEKLKKSPAKLQFFISRDDKE